MQKTITYIGFFLLINILLILITYVLHAIYLWDSWSWESLNPFDPSGFFSGLFIHYVPPLVATLAFYKSIRNKIYFLVIFLAMILVPAIYIVSTSEISGLVYLLYSVPVYFILSLISMFVGVGTRKILRVNTQS